MYKIICDKILIFGGFNGKAAYGMVYNNMIWLLDPVAIRIRHMQSQIHQKELAK